MTSHISGQGRNSSRSAEIDLRWKAAGGWKNSIRLQYPEGNSRDISNSFISYKTSF